MKDYLNITFIQEPYCVKDQIKEGELTYGLSNDERSRTCPLGKKLIDAKQIDVPSAVIIHKVLSTNRIGLIQKPDVSVIENAKEILELEMMAHRLNHAPHRQHTSEHNSEKNKTIKNGITPAISSPSTLSNRQ